MRTKNQFSLERMDEYYAEGETLLKIREEKMTLPERKNLLLFSIYRKFISSVPVVGKAYYYVFIEKLYPPRILFERTIQRFFITEKIHKKLLTILIDYLKRKFFRIS